MAIIGEMNGVPIDDLVYRQPKETGLSRMKVYTISCSVESVSELLNELKDSKYLSYTVENATIWCGGLIVEISGNEGQ